MDGFVAGAALLAAGRFDAARVAFARADDPVDPEALSPAALSRAAAAVAATTGADEAVIADAARYARADADEGRGRFGTLLTDVVVGREPGLAYGRLASLVERRRARERDVDGLF